ncbi:hypothetical protein [Streptococcus infantis]|uniref:hypothetical protein n=2 Tax=Streptococcus infantis TaxID=68892 RepID=UPI0039C1BEEE
MSKNEIGELYMYISDFFINLNWKGIVENLITALVVSGFGYLVSKKIMRDLRISKEMKSYGFKGVVAMKNHTKREIKQLCKDTVRLDLLFISGIGFFKNNKSILTKAMERGMKIRLLCSQVDTVFLSDLERLEENNILREPGTKISDEIKELLELYSDYIKDGKIEIRYYSTEYRLPFIIAYKYKKNIKTIQAWLRVTLPPFNWLTNFALVGERKYKIGDSFFETEKGKIDFISMMEDHFSCVWEVADKKLNEKHE